MTDCLTTARYIGPAKLRSGQGYVMRDGVRSTVVFTAPGPGQIYLTDLTAGEHVYIDRGPVTLTTQADPTATAGARGRRAQREFLATLTSLDHEQRTAWLSLLTENASTSGQDRRMLTGEVLALAARSVTQPELFEDLIAFGGMADLVRPTLVDTSDADDVTWSSNDWCLTKTGPLEAADVVVVRPGKFGDEVLLIKRSHPPFASTWALPGGMRDPGEDLRTTANREMTEEVGLTAAALTNAHWLGEITSSDWDTRFTSARVGAVCYRAPNDIAAIAGDDAVDAAWIPVTELATGSYPLAFGHAQWLARSFVDQPALARPLDVLAQASTARNRRLIAQINVNRTKAGVPTIPQ